MSDPTFAEEARGPWARPRGVALDVGIVLVGLVVVAFYYLGLARGGAFQPLPALLAALQVLPLVGRRVRPGTCLAAVTVLSVLQVLLTDQPGWGQLAVPVTVYSVAAYADRTRLVVALVAGLAGAVVGPVDWLARGGDLVPVVGGAVFCAVVVVASAALGLLGRTRRAYVDQLIDRGVRLEREAAQQAELAASDERARIAREMHDVVAHGLSVMVVQADGARYQLSQDPGRAAPALETIAATGRESLAEMRRMLGLLRSEDPTGTRPQPGLDDLRFLLAQDPGPGLTLSADLPEALPEVGPGVGLAAYRIVQESLTNVRKHAGTGVRVDVAVRAADGVLHLRVRDHGVGGEPAPGGHGLVGMRERAAVHGGRVEAGPSPSGGFEVRATLPYGGGPR
ncbi:two-component sensor histidine kinase [Marmoricola endophyticus]|uniref:histidine kinase n=1 Tax=Marmoricola endophyticus TaxID=2040280 RepID=A0A917F5R3_9ACTN|nr:sensor histidine kinase [Marmoricola endophyticus]GGF49357.1 two-component sensor histidine kinase [Marmoricola endophyticus]